MVNCDDCMKDIGSIEEPIFVDSSENVVCRACYMKVEGHPPNEDEAEYDGDDASQEQIDALKKKEV